MSDPIEARFRSMFSRWATGSQTFTEALQDFSDEVAGRRRPPGPADPPDRERIGVDGSVHRRILVLMESLGFKLIDARDIDHSSRMVLVFDEGTYLSTITIEDTER